MCFRIVCSLSFPLRLVTQRYSAGASREIQKLGHKDSPFLFPRMGIAKGHSIKLIHEWLDYSSNC